jgi:DNA-binding CsgD family transcriptional regulator
MNEKAPCLLKPGGTGPVLRITPRERNALQLLADGHMRNELSRRLGASGSEIDALLEELFAVMGVTTQAEAIAAAQKRGLFKEAWPENSSARSGVPTQVSRC